MSKRVYLMSIALWAVFVIGILLTQKTTPEPPEIPPLVIEEAPIEVVEEEPGIAVEAVVNVFDPVRDDVPLDADTQHLLYQACLKTGIRYELALAVIWQETDFRNIMGDGGNSYGYMQVQEKYHGDRMARLGVTDLSDPYSNFLVGCDYLFELISKDKSLEWALMAYNGGPTYANDMAKAGTVSQYAKNVLDYMNVLTASEE